MAPSASTLRAAFQQLTRESGVLDASQTPCGMQMSPARAHALMVLLGEDESGRNPRQSDLQRTLGIDKSNVSRLVRQMVAADEVRETVCSVDGRARRISLTASGRRTAKRLEGQSLQRFEELWRVLGRSRRGTVIAALQELSEAIKALRGVERPCG